MADAASVTISATVLPDEIAKTIAGGMPVTPADANHNWYYKNTAVTNSSSQLIKDGQMFIDRAAVSSATAPQAIATGDHVQFLLIKNTDASAHVYVNISAGTASDGAGSIIINAGETFCTRLKDTDVDDINAATSSGSVDCIVAAIIDDISV